MRNLLITIEYDGTNYHGWQKQKNAVTVQDVVEQGIQRITGEKTTLIGSGRTDAGVHALRQKANFKTLSRIPADRIPPALNSVLPPDIRVVASQEVDLGFHARYDVISKRYRYRICNSAFAPAVYRNYCYFIREKLDTGLMAAAVQHLTGKKDYSSFCSGGSRVKSKVRTVEVLELEVKRPLIDIIIQADGFLYNMVRIIAGTLVEVGKGKIPPSEVKGILEKRDRGFAGPTLPPQGLFLEEVNYNLNS